MNYDSTVQIKLNTIRTQLSSINPQFLSNLGSDDLRSLLDKVLQAESYIRGELQNVRKK